jgi:hypothetical protein
MPKVLSFLQCPHPLQGQLVRVGSLGTNPFIYTDLNRSVVYGEDGFPLGANSGIAKSLSKMFGFDFKIVLFKSYDYFDAATGKWVGMSGEVTSFNMSMKSAEVVIQQCFQS